jgi:hypothetical protein
MVRMQLATQLLFASVAIAWSDEPTQTLRGKPVACELDVPASWRVISDKDGARITAIGDEAGLMLGVIPENLGDPSAAVKVGRDMATKQDPNATVTEPAPITIDGHKWLQFTNNSPGQDGDETTFLVYSYSGAEGTFVVIGFAPTNLFQSKKALLTRYMNTFRFQKSVAR